MATRVKNPQARIVATAERLVELHHALVLATDESTFIRAAIDLECTLAELGAPVAELKHRRFQVTHARQQRWAAQFRLLHQPRERSGE